MTKRYNNSLVLLANNALCDALCCVFSFPPSTNMVCTIFVSSQTVVLRELWTWRSWSAFPFLLQSPLLRVSRVTRPTASARTPTWAASQSHSSPTRSTMTLPSRSRLNLPHAAVVCCSPSQMLTKRWVTFFYSANFSTSKESKYISVFLLFSFFKIVHLGIALSEVEDGSQRVIFYYTDPGTRGGTQEAASFKMGDLTGRWARFTLTVQGAEVGVMCSLHLVWVKMRAISNVGWIYWFLHCV